MSKIIRINKKNKTISVAIHWSDHNGITKVLLRGNSKKKVDGRDIERDVVNHLIQGNSLDSFISAYASRAITLIIDLYKHNQISVLAHAA